MPVPETIGSKMEYLLPTSTRRNQIPIWPPDVFCLCAAVLQSSGAYSRIIEDNERLLLAPDSERRAARLKRIGSDWAKATSRKELPTELGTLWSIVFKSRNIPLHELGLPEQSACRRALLELLSAGDEASAGLGILKGDPRKKQGGLGCFKFHAESLFVDSMTGPEGGSLCKEIHPSRARVLPKMHTPQSGLTIRSLSHHLGYCPGSDMRPYWYNFVGSEKVHSLNLLLVPWPSTIEASQFEATRKKRVDDEVHRGGYGLFTIQAGPGPSVEYVAGLLSSAESKVGHVDGIVFPELSMSESEFNAIAERFVNPKTFVVAGVGEPAGEKAGRNEAFLEFVNVDLVDEFGDPFHIRMSQKKHHRWKLDKAQIVQYGLGANLHPLANWWEHIELGDRQISFVALHSWLTMSVLICEDLARPDPVGDIVRAVGPNLIIALLCDGPQIASRWPGRYASGFADDPGSSVLTFTNLGMTRLSRPSDPTKNRVGVVALWRDAKTGSTEISCPSGTQGIVLNVTAEYHEEWTADGRGDGKSSGYPVLSGYHLVQHSASSIEGGIRDDNFDSRRGDSISPLQAARSETGEEAGKPPRRKRQRFGDANEPSTAGRTSSSNRKDSLS